MSEEDLRYKNIILIEYLKEYLSTYVKSDENPNGFIIKPEFSTNDVDKKVIVVRETSGVKQVFYNNEIPLYNYFTIEVFGDNIEEEYTIINTINDLIAKSMQYINHVDGVKVQHWQINLKQYSNPRSIQYMDIRRVSYTSTYKILINCFDEGIIG